MIKIAKDLTLPVECVTQTIGIVAKKRSGKSYLARRLAEQLHKAGQQVVIVDPKGDWWGILSAADGKGPGLPIVIIGGERGHVPLESSGGEVVAKLVVEERVSALLDLSLLRKHEVATFMAVFLEQLYRLKAHERFRTPVMLLVDEADAIAPQKPMPNEARMLGAAEDIVRRGGQRGIGCAMITQRTAVLNKNILTQCQVLIALRTISPQDLAAMNAWIDVHGEPEQRKTLMASLPALPVGDAWVWSPGWPTDRGIFQRIHTLPIETFDSGATPKPGQKRVEPKRMADVDLEAVRTQMAATIERAKADDPKELRAQVAALKKQLASVGKGAAPAPQADHERLRARVAELEQNLKTTEAARARLQKAGDLLVTSIQGWMDKARQLLAPVDLVGGPTTPPQGTGSVPPRPTVQTRPSPRIQTSADKGKSWTARTAGGPSLPEGERKILTAIAQGSDGATREQLSVVTGYKRSSRDTYLQRLGAKGFVTNGGGMLRATAEGIAALGSDFEPLPTGAALLEHWLDRLPEGERKILALVARGRGAVSRDELSELTGYKRSSRDTYIQRLSARRLLTTDRDGVTASKELFDG